MTNYMPLLRWKQGEKNALRALSPAGRVGVMPLILLGADNFKGKKATRAAPAVQPAAHFAAQVAAAWRGQPFYLDASPIPDVAGQPHRIVDIAAAARAAGLNLIPATRLGTSPAYQAAVTAVHGADRRGVCLRIDLQEMTSAAAWLPTLPFAIDDTDLVVDFGDGVAAANGLGASLIHAFQNLAQGPRWRSVTVCGTSMPENFQGYAAGVYTVPRIEAALWANLVAAGLPYHLNYGDYATVSTGSPPPNIAWGYPINVKYTLNSDFLICRGVRTTGAGSVDMSVQLVGHAQTIASYAARGPLPHCWADGIIDQIAIGTHPPQGLPFWVELAVNRHIELVRSILP